MIIDFQTLLSNAQAVTASAASTNIYDTGSAADPAVGGTLKFFARVKQAFNTLTSLDVAVQTSVDEAFTSPIVLETRNYLLAALIANSRLDIPTPAQGAKRYIRLYYTVNGSAPTTGTISAGLIDTLQASITVPDGLSR